MGRMTLQFGVSFEIEEEAFARASDVRVFVNRLSDFIRTRHYGQGIEHFTIGVIVIRSKPGYEEWFKERKPRFRRVEKIQRINQSALELHNSYCYDIQLSDEEIDSFVVSAKSAVRVFCQKLIASLTKLESSSMKKRDFNTAAFTEDVEKFIKERLP